MAESDFNNNTPVLVENCNVQDDFLESKVTSTRSRSRNSKPSRSRIPVKIGGKSREPSRPPDKVVSRLGTEKQKCTTQEKRVAVPIRNHSFSMPKSSSCAANFPVYNAKDVPSPTIDEIKHQEKQKSCLLPQHSKKGLSKDKNDKAYTSERNNVVFNSIPSSTFTSGESGENRRLATENMSVNRTDSMERSRKVIPFPQGVDMSRSKQFQLQTVASAKKRKYVQNNDSRYQICPRSEKSASGEDTRIASFRPIQSSNHHANCQPGKNYGGGAMLPVKNKFSPSPKNFCNDTYEGIFYRKRALTGKGPAFPSSNNHASSTAYRNDAQFNSHQRTVFTKIITETNYEYEDEELHNNSRPSRYPGTAFVAKDKPRSQKVTIVDQPTILPSSDTADQSRGYPRRRDNQQRDVKLTSKRSRIPCMILPGHGDPHLELPDPEVKSDVGESVEDEKRNTTPCEKCKVYKNLLSQSEATLRYLTQMLVMKDEQLQNANKNGSTIPPANWNISVERNSPHLNPLLAKEENGEDNGTSTAADGEHPRASQCVVPTFDVDEFIRKYFKTLLFTNDFQESPFTPMQLFHVALSARDCMAQVVKQKLKHAEGILKQKYDILVNMKSSSTEPLDDSVYFAVLDSYRRFVRFIYYYFKQSIKRVENFEQTYISQQRNSAPDEPKSRMVYSREQIVTINGERYTAVVIPIQKLSPEEDTDVDIID